MTPDEDELVDVSELDDDQFADALLAGAAGLGWADRAAVDLLAAQRSWLGRWEFRQAVDAWHDNDGQLRAWVNWADVEMDTPASSGELRLLAIARSLGGEASERSLADLLASLDETNTVRALRAVSIACTGRDTRACAVGHPRGGAS
jgi:hypothetical protein